MVLGHLRDRELRQMWKVIHEGCNSPAAKELKERRLWSNPPILVQVL